MIKRNGKNSFKSAKNIPAKTSVRALPAASQENNDRKNLKIAKRIDRRYISVSAEHGVRQILTKRGVVQDTYHFLIGSSWATVISSMAFAFLMLNIVFGVLYAVGDSGTIGNSPNQTFWESFFFSIQTFATIGYGYWYPNSIYGNIIVTIEAFVQLLATALATGLIFAKFSIPNAKVLFSNNVVIGTSHGKPVLRLRLANARGNQIVEAKITVTVVINEINSEGEFMRRLQDLELDRTTSPLFALSWLVSHEINERSPLFNLSAEQLKEREVNIIVSLMGTDGTSSQTIHTRHFYDTSKIIQNARFADILKEDEDGKRFIDFANFHSVEKSL